MFPLYNGDALFDHIFCYPVEYHLKELGVVVKLHTHAEFGLEIGPYYMVFLGFNAILKDNAFSQILIK